MGYSTPKKQLDLKDFLSQPGKKNTRRTFGYRNPRETTDTPAETPAVEPETAEPETAEPETAEPETAPEPKADS